MGEGGILMVDVEQQSCGRKEDGKKYIIHQYFNTSLLHIVHYIIHHNSSVKHQNSSIKHHNFFTAQSALHQPS